jgi:DNA polymerase I-like protein with 3'-5' exonuclease and polymerase domains
VHDEAVVECDAADAERVSARMHEIMTTAPVWAKGLPLAAEGSIMLRYGK